MSVFIGYRRCVIACLLALLPALSLQAQTTREITLQQASERLLQSSPSLQLFQYWPVFNIACATLSVSDAG